MPNDNQYVGECEEYREIAQLKESLIQHLTNSYDNLSDKEDYMSTKIVSKKEEEENERLKRENEEKNREIERLRAEQNKNGGSCVI